MNCAKCNAALDGKSSFCAACGNPVDHSAPAAAAAPVTPPTPVVASASTNGMAIASLIVSVALALFSCGVLSFIGAILGHVALGQIKQTGQGGRGLALAGVIVGWVVTFIGIIVIFGMVTAWTQSWSNGYTY